MGLAAETVLLHLTQLSQPTPLAPMPTCPVLPRPPMSLLPPSGALQRALLAAFAAAASLSARHFCLRSLGAAIAVLSLSLGQLQPAVSGRHPLGSSPPPSPLNCLLLLLALSQEPGACV